LRVSIPSTPKNKNQYPILKKRTEDLDKTDDSKQLEIVSQSINLKIPIKESK
jgi:hypothetical protein